MYALALVLEIAVASAAVAAMCGYVHERRRRRHLQLVDRVLWYAADCPPETLIRQWCRAAERDAR